MKLACAAIAAITTFLVMGSPASAKVHYYRHQHHVHRSTWPLTTHYPEWPKSTFFGPRWTGDQQPWWKSDAHSSPETFAERHVRLAISGLGPRPHAWCGWFMRQVRGVLDPAFNLAWNWSRWGHATDAHPGAVAVWHHHVGEVASGSCPAGRIMLHSGNDGHAVRTRCVPVRGAIFREV
jgi:hypothetical protein